MFIAYVLMVLIFMSSFDIFFLLDLFLGMAVFWFFCNTFCSFLLTPRINGGFVTGIYLFMSTF